MDVIEQTVVEKNEGKKLPQGAKPWQVAVLMLLSAIIAAAAVILVLSAGTKKYVIVDKQSDTDATLISTLLSEIKKYYYFSDDAPTSEKLLDTAARAVVNAVGDPYAAYYTSEEFTDFRNTMNGNYKGIGVLISVEAGKGVLVNRAYEDNPAAEAGVMSGDYIIAVDGVSVKDMDVDGVSDLIAGEDGTSVMLTVLRGEEQLEISVKRGDVYVHRVYTEELENGIGYIRIESFTGNAANEFNDALNALLDKSIKALLIDVRDNPGGELDCVVEICDRILPECTITTLTGKTIDPPKVYSSDDKNKLEIPYVVLTNGNSASASEIFASAVQDNKTGTLLGTKTFGKGIVQTSWQITEEGSFLKLTTDVYLTPNGNMIHGEGVTPDMIVEQNPDIDENADIFTIRRDMPELDTQFKAAISLLETQIG